MSVVHLDKIETLSMKEKWGVVTEVKRRAVVTGLTGVDWSVMYQALTAAGVPVRNSFLDGASHLHLVDRDVNMVSANIANVDLTYGMFNDRGQLLEWFGEFGNGQWGQNAVAGKMSVSVEQKKTNLYREGGFGPEQQITVSHKYPNEDPDYSNINKTQSGEVDVYIPQRNFTIDGAKYTGNPRRIAAEVVGAINYFFWMGEPPHTWMCTEAAWEYRQVPATFMSFTFQHNPDTWNPTAVFIDNRTDKPPEDLIPGVGFKQIRYQREIDFSAALGFAIIGAS